ncbi:hypothetical protein [Gimesia aquarii]|uniref:Uncharacterized protein n=1 Tax=Gimesia aquarii TaxID=2527964 RepID=A0A517VPN7_9PLAN|nr:hypothetical protein [Gimesia aquarii]QDT94982.1 hypothetical protein V144x_04160 [Gimesia aquarii]
MSSQSFFSFNSRKIFPIFVLALFINMTGLHQVARAQKDPFATDNKESELTPQEQEEAAQELLKGVEKLVLTQQKRIARKVIRLYPKSESAKIAKLILEEYHRFDQIKEKEEKADAAWLKRVRNHWFHERNPLHDSFFFTVVKGTRASAVKITNQSKAPVVYEIKGPSMSWNGPFRLRVGESHEFFYSAQIRFFSDQGVVEKRVTPGQTFQLNDKNTLHINQ